MSAPCTRWCGSDEAVDGGRCGGEWGCGAGRTSGGEARRESSRMTSVSSVHVAARVRRRGTFERQIHGPQTAAAHRARDIADAARGERRRRAGRAHRLRREAHAQGDYAPHHRPLRVRDAVHRGQRAGRPAAAAPAVREPAAESRAHHQRTAAGGAPADGAQLLPPMAYCDNPINAVTTKFVHLSLNKQRCPINAVRVRAGAQGLRVRVVDAGRAAAADGHVDGRVYAVERDDVQL